MKNLILALVLVAFYQAVSAQTSLKKYPIGDSGCSAYFFAEPAPAELSYSPDSSRVYVMESMDSEGITCSTITVVLAEAVEEEIESELLKSYLDYLKAQFEVTESSGFAEGVSLASHPSAVGIRDYWNDGSVDYSVMAYTDGKIIEVMLIHANEKGKDIFQKSEVFFKGFRFPGD